MDTFQSISKEEAKIFRKEKQRLKGTTKTKRKASEITPDFLDQLALKQGYFGRLKY